MKNDRHLDLGCGDHPRNPYGRAQLYGVDVRDLPARPASGAFEYRRCNLFTEPIPFEDSHFASVSAFDFIEHVPRTWLRPDGQVAQPFIALMNEVHRVLEPGGRFYALTPCYPNAEAFVDPTHVNFISDRTHEYFCGPKPYAQIYGFTGRFECLRVLRSGSTGEKRKYPLAIAELARRLVRRMRGRLTHVVWELQAVK